MSLILARMPHLPPMNVRRMVTNLSAVKEALHTDGRRFAESIRDHVARGQLTESLSLEEATEAVILANQFNAVAQSLGLRPLLEEDLPLPTAPPVAPLVNYPPTEAPGTDTVGSGESAAAAEGEGASSSARDGDASAPQAPAVVGHTPARKPAAKKAATKKA